MKARIRNSNIDVEIEGDSQEDILKQFARDYPERVKETLMISWYGGEHA